MNILRCKTNVQSAFSSIVECKLYISSNCITCFTFVDHCLLAHSLLFSAELDLLRSISICISICLSFEKSTICRASHENMKIFKKPSWSICHVEMCETHCAQITFLWLPYKILISSILTPQIRLRDVI